MQRSLPISILCLALFGCGELETSDSLTSNRTLGQRGGSLSLDDLTLTIPVDVLAEPVTFQMTLEEAPSPGPMGLVYRISPDDVPALDAIMTWRIGVDDMPDGVYFVDLALARAEGDEWIPLEGRVVDPVSAVVRGRTHLTGLFTLIQMVDSPQ